MKRIRKINSSKTILTIFAVAFIIAGGIFLYKTAYENGKADGRKNYESETSELVKNLANAISEKVEDLGNISENLNSIPTELDQDSINTTLESIKKITVKNEDAKTILKSYEDSWQALKTTYDTGDNEKIKSEFENLKASAGETTKKLQELYDSRITSALEKL
ncbi:MAG: hypothetical protein Q4A25_02800 [Candidatus Saccharibacteria bacterium]|nr:hypothetical protein [Candidatus Saccharibacteria bacterium]